MSGEAGMNVGTGFASAGAEAARRSAEALLQTMAGDAVVLRMPSLPVGDSDAEDLGLGSPGFQDVVLSPALVRVATGGTTMVLVPAAVVETALGLDGADAVEVALESASFVQVSDGMLQLQRVERRALFGRAYLYRLFLKKPETR